MVIIQNFEVAIPLRGYSSCNIVVINPHGLTEELRVAIPLRGYSSCNGMVCERRPGRGS